MTDDPESGGFIARLQHEARALAEAPIIAAVALLLSLGVIWAVLQWSYGTALSGRDAHIASLERRIADYRDRLGGATPEQARQRIDTLEQELRSLRLRLQPRRLQPAQRQSIIDRSRLPAGAAVLPLIVAYEAGCSDCQAFAEDLFAAFSVQGWEVTSTVIDALADRPRSGLAIRVEQPLRPSPAGVRLQQALRSAGLPFDTVGGATGATVVLLVTDRADL